jgi:carboxyl-terminal processing protease
MERGQLLPRPNTLNQKQSERIFNRVYDLVKKYYFDPKFNGTDWPAIAESRKIEILAIEQPDSFELAMHELVRRLGPSHTGFFHQSVRHVPARLAVGATFSRRLCQDGAQWVAADVHAGGPADIAGLRQADVLFAVNGKPIRPPDQPMFAMGAEFVLDVDRAGKNIPCV